MTAQPTYFQRRALIALVVVILMGVGSLMAALPGSVVSSIAGFDPFNPTRVTVVVGTPVSDPSPNPARPPVRDPFRPPTRSPFIP
jgi:hypothetical protein